MGGDHLENLQGTVISLPARNNGFHIIAALGFNGVGNIDLACSACASLMSEGVCATAQHGAAHAFTKLVFNNLVGLIFSAFSL